MSLGKLPFFFGKHFIVKMKDKVASETNLLAPAAFLI